MPSNFKQPKFRSEAHRRFVASLPCCVSGEVGQSQAAHIRSNTGGGMGMKPSDSYCVPLSVTQHARQHHVSEAVFWGSKLEMAKELANALFVKTGDYQAGLELVERFGRRPF